MNDYFDERELKDDAEPARQPENAAPATSDGEKEPPERSPKTGGRRVLVWFVMIIFVALGVTFWLRYLNPYVTDARVSGYVTGIEKRGIIFKTYEGQMITESSLTDTARVYSRDFVFSVHDPAVVPVLQSLQGTGRPVTVVYEKYYGTLPWRGASNCIVTAIIPKDSICTQPNP